MGLFIVLTLECLFTGFGHTRYTYTNSIIKDIFLKQKLNIMSYAVKTVENFIYKCIWEIYNDNAKRR